MKSAHKEKNIDKSFCETLSIPRSETIRKKLKGKESTNTSKVKFLIV